MKVLQINTWYKVGSTGKLVFSLHNFYLENGIDSYVIYGRGKTVNDKSGHIFKLSSNLESKTNSVLSRLTGIMYGGCNLATKRMLSLINKIKPDIIHIHCTNSFIVNNYKLFNFLGKNNYKVVITLHAEYLYTGSCSHAFECTQWKTGCKKCNNLKFATRSLFFDRTKTAWKKMHNSLNKISVQNRKIIAVSEWLKNNAQLSSTFKDDDIKVIHNGIDTNVFKNYPNENNKYSYLREENKRIYLFVTPSFNANNQSIKGIDYFIEIVNRFKERKDFVFLLVCPDLQNKQISENANIIIFNQNLTQSDLAQLYSVADATLMLSRRETYSLVTAESISCGTPVVGFKSGGPESIALDGRGKFFENGNIEKLVNELENLSLTKDNGTEYYRIETMTKSYINIYKDLLNR